MSILDDNYCQLCERVIAKEQWNIHLYSSKHLHREAHDYWPAYFPHKELTSDEINKLQKAVWKMFLQPKISKSRRVLITKSYGYN